MFEDERFPLVIPPPMTVSLDTSYASVREYISGDPHYVDMRVGQENQGRLSKCTIREERDRDAQLLDYMVAIESPPGNRVPGVLTEFFVGEIDGVLQPKMANGSLHDNLGGHFLDMSLLPSSVLKLLGGKNLNLLDIVEAIARGNDKYQWLIGRDFGFVSSLLNGVSRFGQSTYTIRFPGIPVEALGVGTGGYAIHEVTIPDPRRGYESDIREILQYQRDPLTVMSDIRGLGFSSRSYIEHDQAAAIAHLIKNPPGSSSTGDVYA